MTIPKATEGAVPSIRDIKAIVNGARWAPTGDNAQEFTFDWDGRVLSVLEDRGRGEAFMNVGNMASRISLGMCLATIEIGAEREGWVARWDMGSEGDVVARVTFTFGPKTNSPLAEAVFSRTVDRRPYRPETLPVSYGKELVAFMENPWGIRFRLVDNPTFIQKLVRIMGGFEPEMFAIKGLHHFLFRWLRWTEKEAHQTGDGMPIQAMGVGPLDAVNLRLLSSWRFSKLCSIFGFTGLAAVRAGKVYNQSSALGVFTVPNIEPLSFIRVGWLWQRLWLQLAADGWSLQPIMGNSLMGLLCRHFGGAGLTDAQKERFTRDEKELRHLISAEEGETLAIFFRMGRSKGPVPARAPRRPLHQVLRIRS